MTTVVPIGRSLDDIVDYVLQATIRWENPSNMVQHLTTVFGLTQGDAELALDRSTAHAMGSFSLRLDDWRTARQKNRTRWRD